PAEACQAHHLDDWATGGDTDLPNLALLCWAHHRQVDLRMWTIEPADADNPVPRPDPGAPPGTPWPANNNAPWTITRTPRTRWRL
ncbi:MAG TPA: HNH endonuclease signature motif containing protein, partial [Motilibacterales bacterium]|nr:HNH endonuclease signature motif containing protein [Motilibacterales bacterium]